MFRFYGDDQDGGKLDLNDWYHLVGVYDKDKPESRLYVNGENVANKAGSGGLKASAANSDFEIGANYGRLGRADWFHGIIAIHCPLYTNIQETSRKPSSNGIEKNRPNLNYIDESFHLYHY